MLNHGGKATADMVTDKGTERKKPWHQNRWLGRYSNGRRRVRGGIHSLKRIRLFAKHLAAQFRAESLVPH